ncbi:RHS repeat protein, partial [Halochromatium glycolicum]|nr:hypothetical protein [Halochromatium glycolicum]
MLSEQRTYAFAGDPAPHLITYTRNPLGQATAIHAPEVDYTLAYDAAHRLARVTDARGNARLEYDWSPGGLLDTLRDDRGRQTDYLYDPTGRLTTLWAPDGALIGYTFDDAGRLTRRDLPGGVSTQYDYLADDALESLTTTAPGGPIHSQGFTYDTLGRRATMTETLGGVSRSHTYGYDALSRLLSVDTGGAVEAWTYDAFGNRVTHTPPAGPVAHYVHDDAHQLLEIREGSPAGPLVGQLLYDANGNLTKQCTGNVTDLGNDCTGDDTLTLAYDALDRQVQATRTGLPAESYTYDPQGRRIAKTVGATTTHYHYDGDALYQQVEGDWSDPVARYVHGAGIDSPILHYTAGQTLVYHQDGHNSVVATTDAATGA